MKRPWRNDDNDDADDDDDDDDGNDNDDDDDENDKIGQIVSGTTKWNNHPGQFGVHLLPGWECFAPFMISSTSFMKCGMVIMSTITFFENSVSH